MNLSSRIFVAALLVTVPLPLLAGGAPPEAEDWNQWRGPRRDGSILGPAWPDSLDGLRQIWRIPLGDGYAGPIAGGGRVFVVETVDAKSVAARALDGGTGRELWKTTWSATGDVPFFAKANGDWIRSTPAFDGQALYVGDMREVLVALDADTGAERWRVDFPERYGTKIPDFGFASSPLVDGEHLYVQAANSLVKVDRKTGKSLWRSLEHSEKISASGAFSSPVLAEIEGVRQVVTLTRHALYGVDPENGSVLWSHEVPNFRGMNILTPAVSGNTIFTSPYRQRSFLYTIRRVEGAWSVEETWSNKSTGYMSSPVILDGHAYLHLGNQRAECVDLETGESRWRTQSFGKYWSMVHDGEKILALDESGQLLLFRANPEAFELLGAREVSEDESWGYLAVHGGRLFVREQRAIAAYRWVADETSSDVGPSSGD